jgi:sugar/nucleoside kinase (ribokinase family)
MSYITDRLKKDNTMEIAGLGFGSVDYLCIVPHIPIDEKVGVIEKLTQGGGAAATAVVAASRLGADAAFIGVVGDDTAGKEILDSLEKENVDTRHMQVRPGKESAVAYCWIEQNSGKRSIAWSRGTAMPMDAGLINEEFISSLKLLHLDGHNMEAAVRAAEIAHANGVAVSLDAGSILPGIEKLVNISDICIASEFFACNYTGEKTVKEALCKLYMPDKKVVAVTMGDKGVIAMTPEGIIQKDAFKVDVVDTTGAGDVFHGAFARAWIMGWNVDKCLDFASATAAIKCTRFGGRTGIPGMKEVENFLIQRSIIL